MDFFTRLKGIIPLIFMSFTPAFFLIPHHASIQHSDKGATAYRHHTNDIFCNRFTLNGTDLGCIRVNRHASAQASEIVTTHDDGERIAAFRMEEKTARPKAPTFYNLGLGFYSRLFLNSSSLSNG